MIGAVSQLIEKGEALSKQSEIDSLCIPECLC